jgi:hypothetical protein
MDMKRFIVCTIAIALLGLAAGGAQAEKCYWTQCNAVCVEGKTSMGTRTYRTNRTRDCKKTFCCPDDQAKKLKKDDGWVCRAKCAGKPNGGPYFKCMDKCLGRTR